MLSADTKPSKRRLRRIDHLEQFLADLRRVAGGNLAVADHAIEGRAHHGALQLLACGHQVALRPLAVALRGVAAHLGVLDLLGRDQADRRAASPAARTGAAPVRRPVLRCAPRLRAEASVSRMELASRRTSRSPFFTVSPFSFSTCQHHGGNFGAQVGAPLRQHRAGDGRTGRQGLAVQAYGGLRADSVRAGRAATWASLDASGAFAPSLQPKSNSTPAPTATNLSP